GYRLEELAAAVADILSDPDSDFAHEHSQYAAADHTHADGGGDGGSAGPHDHEDLYQPLGDYADGDHEHDPVDLTHDHEGVYAPDVHDHDEAYKHDHPYAADDHDHDEVYEPKHDHPYAPTKHLHSEYFLAGANTDEDGKPLPLPYANANSLGEAVNRKSDQGHGHDNYATKIALEELELEVEALATTREAGRWKVASSQAVRPGEVHFATTSMLMNDNLLTISNTDVDGTVHGWTDLQVGDYLEVVQETSGVRSVGSYGLFKVTADNGGFGMRSVELQLDRGSGSLEQDSNVFIKVFHANNDMDLAELDSRYAFTEHQHDFTHDHDLVYQPLGDYATGDHGHPPQDLTHDHDGEYAPVHEHPYASNTHNHETLYQPKGDYAEGDHTHPEPTGFWGMWSGTQSQYDALSVRSNTTLYVVI
ncbi:MAG: hypothetical protein L7S57_00305, partial [Luminiphilus sp.]|nr:hypothetical protein [Luminiphilus sp.]